jgi:ATP synthase protein I
MKDDDSLPPLKPLEEKINLARNQLDKRYRASGERSQESYGLKAGMDLVSGVAVGTGIGYGIDRWAGTLPLFMLIGLAIGVAAGVKLMMETSARASRASQGCSTTRPP